jgi:uncharacterized metal-binding protein YceD (DUF177 family)
MTELSRPVVLDRLGAGAEHVVDARPEELEPLARRLMIPAVNRLHCGFRLHRGGAGVIEAQGQLEAEIVQVCVLSLDEFPQLVREEFAIQFVPAGSETEDDDPDSPDQIPYEDGVIDLGEAAAEQLALALDPYPKKPGAAEPASDPAESPGPFAGLAALRPKQ